MQLTSRESLMPRAATNTRRGTHSGNRLGERVRQLRVAAGLTQTDLAGDRFSKEYVSQIERGKTRPTRETIEWLAVKLGVRSEERRVGKGWRCGARGEDGAVNA